MFQSDYRLKEGFWWNLVIRIKVKNKGYRIKDKGFNYPF
jgi:hypothetical protein